jgi:hypothetical protein
MKVAVYFSVAAQIMKLDDHSYSKISLSGLEKSQIGHI